MKQAPREWFFKLNNTLHTFGFVNAKLDTSLFIYSGIYILCYVDDIIITENNATLVVDMIKKLDTSFSLKDLGKLSYFLGIEVHRTNSNQLHLSQAMF